MVSVPSALVELRTALKALYGDRLVRLVLYGSWARGEAHAESDMDVMVVLRGPVRPAREIARMNTSAFEIGLAHGVLLSTFPISEQDYETEQTTLLANVREEGIPL